METMCREYVYGSSEHRRALILRYMILRLETGVSSRAENQVFELDPEEKEHALLGVFEGDVLLGTVNLKPEGEGSVLLRSLAVDDKCQGMGIGKKLVLFAHEVAREKGYKRIVLNARLNVIGFYEKLGYTLTGNRRESPRITLAEMELIL